jgi:hypothetical protein
MFGCPKTTTGAMSTTGREFHILLQDTYDELNETIIYYGNLRQRFNIMREKINRAQESIEQRTGWSANDAIEVNDDSDEDDDELRNIIQELPAYAQHLLKQEKLSSNITRIFDQNQNECIPNRTLIRVIVEAYEFLQILSRKEYSSCLPVLEGLPPAPEMEVIRKDRDNCREEGIPPVPAMEISRSEVIEILDDESSDVGECSLSDAPNSCKSNINASDLQLIDIFSYL